MLRYTKGLCYMQLGQSILSVGASQGSVTLRDSESKSESVRLAHAVIYNPGIRVSERVIGIG